MARRDIDVPAWLRARLILYTRTRVYAWPWAMRERRTRRDQVALEALWQTHVVIDEICNPNWIGRVEETDFAFVRLRLITNLMSLETISSFFSKRNKKRGLR